MLQQAIRKHRTAMGWIILLSIGVPMLFFGVPAFWDTAATGEDPVLASVGGVPIYASAFRRSLDATAAQKRSQGGERPSYRELEAQGDVQNILEQLINSALITYDVKNRGFDVEREALVARMKEWRDFQMEDPNAEPGPDGQRPTVFNSEAWNEWVQNFDGNWNEIYEDLRDQVARETFVNFVQAPGGRILESDIEEQLIANSTKIRIKYAQIAPPIELSDADLQKEYDENPDTYRKPEQWIAEFVALPLEPSMPQKATDIVEELRGGADFATVADEKSDITSVKNGGDMGWQIPRGEDEFEHRKPLYELAVGEISDPVKGPGGYFIYTIDEERTNDETGAREVKGRQIFVTAALTDEEREARAAEAKAISDKAKELDSLEGAAAEAGVTVQRTGQFDNTSAEVEGLPRADAVIFRASLSPDDEAKNYDVITGRENLYIAKVVEREEGQVPPFEDVKDQVTTNAETAYKASDEYKDQVAEYADKINELATSLEQAQTLFPELAIEIQETAEPFTRRDFLFQQQIYLQTAQIYDQVGEAEAGTMAGPLTDFRNDTYFIELIERMPPTDEELADMEEERQNLRDSEIRSREFALLTDYLQDYRERVLPTVSFTMDAQLMDLILGPEEDAADSATAETTPAGTDEPAA